MLILVTGIGGFLGTAIAKQLVAQGYAVRGVARSCYPSLSAQGIATCQGDLTDYQAVLTAARNCDAVIHVAAKTGVWGDYQHYYQTNVIGTENVLRACRTLNIDKLVYTSTPSVIFDGCDENGVNESTPYARKHLCHYSETKAEAEQMVLSANNSRLMTVALRPHLIWGPGDPHLVPRIVQRATAGRMRLIGFDDKLVDTVYIDNAAEAHVLALNKLNSGADIGGRAYFISNDEPILMADMIHKILNSAGVAPVTKRIPAPLAYGMGSLLELVYGVLKIQHEPIMTRFVAKQLSTAHWFDISAAKKELGYQPRISLDHGMELLTESFKRQRAVQTEKRRALV